MRKKERWSELQVEAGEKNRVSTNEEESKLFWRVHNGRHTKEMIWKKKDRERKETKKQ